MTLTFGSLFAGIGGIDLGLERAGMRCVWQVEIDDYCRRVLAKHWPDVRRHDDVRTFPPPCGICFRRERDEEPGNAEGPRCACAARDWAVDLIAGGDPCQENSRARITTGTRAPSLGAEFIRVVGIIRPRLVLRENPSRVRRDAPWPWQRFRDELELLGYVVLPFRIRACCLGSIHQRERLFLLASLPDTNGGWIRREGCSANDGSSPSHKRESGQRKWIRPDLRPMGSGVLLHANGKRLQGIDREGKPEKYAGRTTPRVVRPAGEDSLPTPRICRSRNEVPHQVDRIRGLGNAVVPQIAEWIGRRILEAAMSGV